MYSTLVLRPTSYLSATTPKTCYEAYTPESAESKICHEFLGEVSHCRSTGTGYRCDRAAEGVEEKETRLWDKVNELTLF